MSLSRYQLIQEIGHGLWGTVYLANDPVLNRKVAIKLFRHSHADSATTKLLSQEAQKITGFVHPGIAQIYDIGLHEDNLFYVMEHVLGQHLNEWLAPEQGVAIPTFEQRLQLFTDILNAVKCAHDHGVLHLNLKPSNIIVLNTMKPKLLDFGLYMANQTEAASSHSPNISLYMAPEQVSAANNIGKGTDIFSLGIILYEMLTGRVPYSTTAPDKLAREILHAEPTPASRCNPAIPSFYDDILSHMLAKDRQERYSDIRQLLHDLYSGSNLTQGTPAPLDQRGNVASAEVHGSNPGMQLPGGSNTSTLPDQETTAKHRSTSNILASLGKDFLSANDPAEVAPHTSAFSPESPTSRDHNSSSNNPDYQNRNAHSPNMMMPPPFRPAAQRSAIMPSPNSRYCVTQKQDSLCLYRANDLLWTRHITDFKSLSFVSDNGDVFYRTKIGLFKASSAINVTPKTLSWDHDLVNLFNTEIAIKNMKFNDQGFDVVVEVLGPPPADTSIWKRLFFTNNNGRVTPHHLLYAIRDGGSQPYLLFNTPASPDGTFFWNVSPSFSYMVVAIWGNNSRYHFQLYSHLNHERVGDFHLPPCTVQSIHVADDGRITMQVTSLSGQSSLIVRERNGKSLNCALPAKSSVLHVGLDTVCYTSGSEIILQHFSGKIMSSGDTSPLDRFKLNYKFAFDRKGNLTLIMCNSTDMWILPIEPTHLDMAAKRWQRILAMRQDYEHEVLTSNTRQEEAQKTKQVRYEEVRGQLDQSLNTILNKRLHRELANRTKEGITMENVNQAVSDALKFAHVDPNAHLLPTPVRLEIPAASHAPAAAHSGLITNLPSMRSHEAIVADIKQLCELNLTGRISPQGYTNRLGALSDELLKLHKSNT